jgi:apolipoprotein N-acyltransferase
VVRDRPVRLQSRRELTTYARCGDLALLLLALAGIVISLRSRVRQS